MDVFLNVALDTKQSPPTVVRAGLYSFAPESLSTMGGIVYTNLTHGDFATFEEGKVAMHHIVKVYYPWLLPYLEGVIE